MNNWQRPGGRAGGKEGNTDLMKRRRGRFRMIVERRERVKEARNDGQNEGNAAGVPFPSLQPS